MRLHSIGTGAARVRSLLVGLHQLSRTALWPGALAAGRGPRCSLQPAAKAVFTIESAHCHKQLWGATDQCCTRMMMQEASHARCSSKRTVNRVLGSMCVACTCCQPPLFQHSKLPQVLQAWHAQELSSGEAIDQTHHALPTSACSVISIVLVTEKCRDALGGQVQACRWQCTF